ncbi:unnamed protein product [Urochloa humidicola]
MAASKRSRKRTASRCTPETDRCTHVFEITGYNMLKGLGSGKSIRSATFAVGGHDWCIQYCPDGDYGDELKDYISIFLELKSMLQGEVRTLFSFKLVDQVTGLSKAVDADMLEEVVYVYSRDDTSFGHQKFIKRRDLEASQYLRNNRLMIECDIVVIMGAPVSTTCNIHVPPSDLSDHLGKLLEVKEGLDVTFNVGGEVFHAHKIVLAMRSPVFMAEFYRPMKEASRESITIEDIQPSVFKLLLHFIYTDSLPDIDDLDVDDKQEFVKRLLLVADRYAMDRMKLLCESILYKRLDAENVVNIFALADQHHCSNNFKDACIEFMLSSSSIDDVVTSKGYDDLKRASPAATVKIWEKAAKSRKI